MPANQIRRLPSLLTDHFVDIEIMPARMVPGIIAAHAVGHELAEILRIGIPHADGAMQRRLNARRVKIVEDIAIPVLVWPVRVVCVEYRVRQSARRANNGDSSISE